MAAPGRANAIQDVNVIGVSKPRLLYNLKAKQYAEKDASSK